MPINLKVFSKLVLQFLMGVAKYTQIANQIKQFLEEQYIYFLEMDNDLHQSVKNFPILHGCVEANALSQSNGRIF